MLYNAKVDLNLNVVTGHAYYIYIYKATYNKYICQIKEKQYIPVGTVKIFIETSAKHLQLLG